MLNQITAIINRRKNMRMAFEDECGKEVLSYLRKFCCVDKSTAYGTQQEMNILEGRRQVYLEITKYLAISDEDIAKLKENHDRTEQRYPPIY